MGVGVSKNVSHDGWPTTKKTKKTFFENVISGKQHFYICPHVPVEIISFFIPDFLVESLKPTKTSKKSSLILQYSFTQKVSLSLQTSTHLRLKIIYSQNIAKNLSHFINFPASMFMFGIKKKNKIKFALHNFVKPKNCILEALWTQMSTNFCISP